MHTRSNIPGQKERKKIGDFGLVNLNFSHQKTKYLQYKHLFKTMSQTVTNQKNLKTFISFDSKELTYFYRNFTEKIRKCENRGFTYIPNGYSLVSDLKKERFYRG